MKSCWQLLRRRRGVLANTPLNGIARTVPTEWGSRIGRYLAGLLLVVCASGAFSQTLLDVEPSIGQMEHSTWTARDGAPQSIHDIAQAADGTLWLGAFGGLYSFDGRTFKLFVSATGEPVLPSSPLVNLRVTRDGSVWASFYLDGVARIKDGHVSLYKSIDGEAISSLEQLQDGPNNSVWALANRKDIVRFDPGETSWHKQSLELPDIGRAGAPGSLFFDSSWTLWIAEGGNLYRRGIAEHSFEKTPTKLDIVVGWSETSNGTLWVSDVEGTRDIGRTQHIDHRGQLIEALKLPEMAGLQSAPDGSLWLLTQDQGLLRLSSGSARAHRLNGLGLESFSHKEGLASTNVTTSLVDTDGNIWFGGEHGLDMFRTPALVPFAPEVSGRWSVCSSGNGETWISSSSNHLFQIKGGTTEEIQGVGDIYQVLCDRQGEVWALDHAGLWKVHGHTLRSVPLMPSAGPYSVLRLSAAKSGRLYARMNDVVGGLWTYNDGEWKQLHPAIARRPLAQIVDSEDRVWTAYPEGQVSIREQGLERLLPRASAPVGVIRAFAETSYGVMAACKDGIYIFREGSFHAVHILQSDLTQGLTGVAESSNGDVWLSGSAGVVRIEKDEVERAGRNEQYSAKIQLIPGGDYIGPAAIFAFVPVSGSTSMVQKKDDPLWFVTLTGLFYLDPEQKYQKVLPGVSVAEMSAEGVIIGDSRKVAPHPQSVTIKYLALTLTEPQKVIYRTKLDGVDPGWQDVGANTSAVYFRLRPGTYTFHVMASVGNGIWTNPISASSFVVLPSFYQTWWFYVLCALAFLCLIGLAFSFRLRQVTFLIRARADERANERVRIARDLHDTLLQSVQALLLSFHLVAIEVPAAEARIRLRLEKALKQADLVISEGRNRVTQLRSEHINDRQLIEQLEAVCISLNGNYPTSFEVRRVGNDNELLPHVADEIFHIGREALVNAFQHAEAKTILLTLDYGDRCFAMICEDDGKGFDLEEGRAAKERGHWGLRGMEERAERIGSKLGISVEGPGTTITVEVRSRFAYVERNRLGKFARWYRGNFQRATPG